MPNYCKCPQPPGGQVVCDETQSAFCRVCDGEVTSGCLSVSPPPHPLLVPLATYRTFRQTAHAAELDTKRVEIELPMQRDPGGELLRPPERMAFRLLTWPWVWLKVRRSLRLDPAVTLLNRALYDLRTGIIVRPEVRVAVTVPPAWGVSKPTAMSEPGPQNTVSA